MKKLYSFTYFPPMPILPISLFVPEQAQWYGPFTALVDSGADFTIIPLKLIEPLNLPVIGAANMVSQWQDRREAHVYLVDLQIGSIVLAQIEVAGDSFSDELILGRNVLNDLDLRLNGPDLQLELSE